MSEPTPNPTTPTIVWWQSFATVSALVTGVVAGVTTLWLTRAFKPAEHSTDPGAAAAHPFIAALAVAGILVLAVGVWLTIDEARGRMTSLAANEERAAGIRQGTPVPQVLELLTKVNGSPLILIAGVVMLVLAASFATDLVPLTKAPTSASTDAASTDAPNDTAPTDTAAPSPATETTA